MDSVSAAGETQLLAPHEKKHSAASYLYTVGFVLLLLAFSYAGQDCVGRMQAGRSHILLYSFLIVWEFILLGLVWVGARLANLKFKDLIGGRGDSFESFLLDVAIA